jgi:hypothetical protein
LVAAALAGCGTTTYFAGRTLPPSGLANRVLVVIQNISPTSTNILEIMDAYYDIRFRYNSPNTGPAYSIAGYSGNMPLTIQNMPVELSGAVYGSGDGSLAIISYAQEQISSTVGGLNGLSSSVYATRNQSYVFATSLTSHVLTVVDRSSTSAGSYPLSASEPLYRVSVNPGGSAALVFAQNSNYVYYPRKLTAAQSTAYAGGPSKWPLGAVDCEPQNEPGWCLFQALDPASTPAKIIPLTFDRPVKAVFSADGGTAYVLNCGPECGGNAASVSILPVAPMIFLIGQASGTLPTTTNTPSVQCGTVNIAAGCISIPGGASNALVDSSTLYVVGQKQMSDFCGSSSSLCWGGYLTVVNLQTNTVVPSTVSVPNPVSISDGAPGAMSRMVLADDNTLWIGMTKCTNGERANNGLPYGCLTMFNTSTNTVTMLEPYEGGDATGIAAVTGLHKIYSGGRPGLHLFDREW